jgi:hypothetical protein
VTLVACSLPLAACLSQAGRLQLLAIDFDPGAKLSPGITHDLELQTNCLKLWTRCILNFYCEFFHFLLSFLIVALLGLEACSLRLISFRNFLELFT